MSLHHAILEYITTTYKRHSLVILLCKNIAPYLQSKKTPNHKLVHAPELTTTKSMLYILSALIRHRAVNETEENNIKAILSILDTTKSLTDIYYQIKKTKDYSQYDNPVKHWANDLFTQANMYAEKNFLVTQKQIDHLPLNVQLKLLILITKHINPRMINPILSHYYTSKTSPTEIVYRELTKAVFHCWLLFSINSEIRAIDSTDFVCHMPCAAESIVRSNHRLSKLKPYFTRMEQITALSKKLWLFGVDTNSTETPFTEQIRDIEQRLQLFPTDYERKNMGQKEFRILYCLLPRKIVAFVYLYALKQYKNKITITKTKGESAKELLHDSLKIASMVESYSPK